MQEKEKKKCLRCEADFIPYTYKSFFCSKACRKKYGKKFWGESEGSRFRKTKYRLHLKDKCEFCGFIPIHICQLDIDHIDGNHYNNDPTNLQTLCANCHRLKTITSKDHLKW